MNFLEELWRLTDDIFTWKFWKVMKWITGSIIILLIIYLIYVYYVGLDFEFNRILLLVPGMN